MAIWSLTQERIDKLRKQVGDKESEFKKLSDTSPKDLWRADLDDFINEWREQVEEEAKQAKKISQMGRRDSKKLKIAGKGGKKRKAHDDSDEDSDDDFGAPASKKSKAADLFDPLVKKERSPKGKKPVASKAKQGLLNFDSQPVSKPPAVERGLIEDAFTGIVSSDNDVDHYMQTTKLNHQQHLLSDPRQRQSAQTRRSKASATTKTKTTRGSRQRRRSGTKI